MSRGRRKPYGRRGSVPVGRRLAVALLAAATSLAAVAEAQGPEASGAVAPPPGSAAPASSVAPAPAPSRPDAPSLDEPTLNEIGRRAEDVAAQLRNMTKALGDGGALATLETEVSAGVHRVGERWGETGRLLEASPRRAALESKQSEWSALRDDLDKLRAEVEARDQAREADLQSLAGLRESWERTLDLARRSGAPAPIIARAEQTLAAIDATHAQVDTRRAQTLVLQDAVSRAMQGCDDAIARIDNAAHAAAERTLEQHLPPIWKADRLFTDPRTGQSHGVRLSENAREGVGAIVAYVDAKRIGFALTALLALLLALVLRRARARVERWSRSDPALAAAVPVFRAPHAAALILALMLSIPLRPHQPAALRSLLLLVALPALIALLRPLLNRGVLPSFYALAVLFVLETLRETLVVMPGLEQLMLVLEMAAATAVLLSAGRQLEAAETRSVGSPWFGKAASSTLRLLGLGAAVAAAAAVAGYLDLADFAGGGSIFLAYLVFVAVAVRAAFGALLALVLGAGPTSRLRAAQRHRALVERRAGLLLDILVAVVWMQRALDRFELLDPARALIGSIVDAKLQIGDLVVSVGHVLGFPLVLVTAYLLARAVVFFLEEDVYSRMALPRGVPYALSSLTRYGLVLVGFFLALGTLGFDLTRLTVLVSAFGLGIGFGLQQIVNNFVSGLILLFERPVQVGDSVQLGDMLGQVMRIGIRSSTIRTLQGAEVIVPNSSMLEEKVTNWTLSDRKRRIDLTLGVAYGTDAARMVKLLVEVAGENPDVASEPAPEAFFVGFGESSLDFQLRAWTDDPRWSRLRSELGIALQQALRDAGIEVPYPQRDVHVRSVPAGPREDREPRT